MSDEIEDLKRRVAALETMVTGKCPECGRTVKGWQPPFGSFAPEAWATLRESGIDPGSGHRQTCQTKPTII